MTDIIPQKISVEEFLPFGDIIHCDPDKKIMINHNRTERYNDLASIQVLPPNPKILVNIFKGQPISSKKYKLQELERHPLGSQAFIPINDKPYLIVVAPSDNNKDKPDISKIKAFVVDSNTGINYHANTWHHPLLPLYENSLFTVIDRGGDGNNLEVFPLENLYIDPKPIIGGV